MHGLSVDSSFNYPFFSNRNVRISIAGFLDMQDLARMICTGRFFGRQETGCFREDVLWKVWEARLQINRERDGPIRTADIRNRLPLPRSNAFSYSLVARNRYYYYAELKVRILQIFRYSHILIPSGVGYSVTSDAHPVIDKVTSSYSHVLKVVDETKNLLGPVIIKFIKHKLHDCIRIIAQSSKISPNVRREAIYLLCVDQNCKNESLVPLLNPQLLTPKDRASLLEELVTNASISIFQFIRNSGPTDTRKRGELLIILVRRKSELAFEYLREGPISKVHRAKALYEALKNEFMTIALELLRNGPFSEEHQHALLKIICKKGYEAILRECFGMGWKTTPLDLGVYVFLASRLGHSNIVRILLKRGEIPLELRYDSFQYAIKAVDLELVILLKPNMLNEDQRGKLLFKARGNRDISLIIFRSGPFQYEELGEIFYYAWQNRAYEICEYLRSYRLTEKDYSQCLTLAIADDNQSFFNQIFNLTKFTSESRSKLILTFFKTLLESLHLFHMLSPEERRKVICALETYKMFALVFKSGTFLLALNQYFALANFVISYGSEDLLPFLEYSHLENSIQLRAILRALRVGNPKLVKLTATGDELVEEVIKSNTGEDDLRNLIPFLLENGELSVTSLEYLILIVRNFKSSWPLLRKFPFSSISESMRGWTLSNLMKHYVLQLNSPDIFDQIAFIVKSGTISSHIVKEYHEVIEVTFHQNSIDKEQYQQYKALLPPNRSCVIQ